MKKKSVVFLFVICIAASVNVFADSLEDLTGADLAAQLLKGGEPVTEVQLRKPVFKLLPANAELRQFSDNIKAELAPSVMVETLSLLQKPASLLGAEWDRVSLFNKMLALSTLTGIEYYSSSRGDMRIFYDLSQVIDSPETKNPLPDPVFSQLPPSITLYARQRDLTFGDNIYRYDFETTPGAFFFAQENITPMKYGIITAVGKSRLRSVFAVIELDDSLLIYAVSMAKTVSIPGLGDRIGNSFTSRAQAILKWFADSVDTLQ